MKIFEVPFGIANEVVKRNQEDNRRLIESPANGGNNFFYLGTPDQFINKFDNPVRAAIIQIQDLCEAKFNNPNINPRTLQKGEGMLVSHKISKAHLISLISFIRPYLEQYGNLYHNPNFDAANVLHQLNQIQGDDLVFKSDLVFIRDANLAKPYFKWFNYEDTIDNFKLTQEFFIPHLAFLNFQYENYEQNTLGVRWELSYTTTVMYCSDSVEAVVSDAIEKLQVPAPEIETIREAITKIRIGQSQFRNQLLLSNRNSCLFTGITDSKLLVASHIKPWRDSNNIERLDIENGILLTPTFDKLFDKFLITFDENGHLIWSATRLNADTIERLTNGNQNFNDLTIQITDLNREYFNHHRAIFVELENVL